MTAMPGFIDAHRHIINGNADQWFKEQAAVRMQEFLESGYTTLMSGGGPVPGIVQLKERIEKGQLKGPRIITSGRADPDLFKTADEARAQVRMLKQAGVEIIKARIEPPAAAEQVAMLAVVADEAKKQNLEVDGARGEPEGDGGGGQGGRDQAGSHAARRLADEGRSQVHQGRRHRDAVDDRLRRAGIRRLQQGQQADVPRRQAVARRHPRRPGDGREAGEKAVNARTLWDAGVTYGFGTDTGYHPKAGLAHELRALNLMFSPQDIVKLMGPNTAAFLEKSNDLGTLETGKLADIVLLNGNPLDGYWNLLNATVVIKGGEVVVDKR